ncbi:MAG: hypothetical protein IJF74_04075 [Clostridia bacterium]|nr:hypothetical protein [Clostridia bacterium]
MPEHNDKNKHQSAPAGGAPRHIAEDRKKPQQSAPRYMDDDDFESLEQRFSGRASNKYYAKVSTGYRNVKLILVILLTAVIAFALVVGADNFTYSNLRYLLRNFGEANSGDAERAASVEFHGADGTDLGIYAGKLAVAGTDNVSLFRMSGKRIYEVSTALTAPIVTCGDKYFFVWSAGESEVLVFNAVSRVGSISADGPVYALSADDNGSFAILYKDKAYSSSVAVFDPDMQKTATKNMPHDNAVDIALSGDGSMLYTLSFTAKDGGYLAKLDFSDIIGGAVAHTYTYIGEFPLKLGSFADGGCYAVTDKAVYVYSRSGELLLRHTLSTAVKSIFDCYPYVCIAGASNGGSAEISIISVDGEMTAEVPFDGTVLDACITDDGLFVLSSSTVLVSLEDGSKQLVCRSPNATGLLRDGNSVYCVYTGKAELVFSDGSPVNSAADTNAANK